jgi:hypothetical protein
MVVIYDIEVRFRCQPRTADSRQRVLRASTGSSPSYFTTATVTARALAATAAKDFFSTDVDRDQLTDSVLVEGDLGAALGRPGRAGVAPRSNGRDPPPMLALLRDGHSMVVVSRCEVPRQT